MSGISRFLLQFKMQVTTSNKYEQEGFVAFLNSLLYNLGALGLNFNNQQELFYEFFTKSYQVVIILRSNSCCTIYMGL